LADERLKILMIAPTPFFADRGCHVRIYEEARALIDLGHDVRIVTYHLGRDMEGITTVRISQIPWYKKLSPGPSWHKPYLDILLFFMALSTARRSRPDIIHAHLHEGAFVGLLLGKLLHIPMLFDCQGSMTAEMIDHGFIRKGTLLYVLFLFLEKIVNRGADFIITSSGAGAADLMGLWGLPPGKVEGLMDGVDSGIFRPFPRTEARMALKFGDDRPTVVFLGVLNGYQGIDLLLEVVKILKERGRAPRFLIMGFPEKIYRERAESLGIADLITFTGRIDYSISPFYLSAGDIAVSPKISLTEANGKLLNYMACGLPTVVFDNPVNREILGDAGIYAYYGDAADFAKKIEELLDDRKGREDLSRRGREKAVRDHSWHGRGERLVEIYRKIVKSPCH
jgi:glycosyltransferase involved in cell wall biosynthesis